MKKLQSASVNNQSSVAASGVSKSPVASGANGLTESVHQRISSSPLKSSLPHSSDSSSKILADNGVLASCV